VLALLQGETFDRFDPERHVGARISAVNLSEVVTANRIWTSVDIGVEAILIRRTMRERAGSAPHGDAGAADRLDAMA
jgi:hypothetical protein